MMIMLSPVEKQQASSHFRETERKEEKKASHLT
jgi:hypothetical protein